MPANGRRDLIRRLKVKVNQLHSCARPYKETSCGATVRAQVSQVFCFLTTQQAML